MSIALLAPLVDMLLGPLAEQFVPGNGKLLLQLGKLQGADQDQLLKLLSEDNVKKLALWSEAFSKTLNDLNCDVDVAQVANAIGANVSDDFFKTMDGTAYVGKPITFEQIQVCHREITTAIKAQNWFEALQVGLALSGSLPVA